MTTSAKETETQMWLSTQTGGHHPVKLIWHEVSRRVVTAEASAGAWTRDT